MLSTRKIIRVFLASPSDLQDERKAVREVVNEFNDSWANEFGYQVELVGWEETVSRFGRPQHLINEEVDRCDLFIGMIWKRWGTPPDRDGRFSSGFQEEFERSLERREKTKSPEISLFFKEIPNEFTEDPGNDLKEVLKFRETVIASKKILFQKFAMLRDMEVLARKCITEYVNRVRKEDESSEPDERPAIRARLDSAEVEEDDKKHESSPLSAKGFKFLENLVERIGQPDSLDALSASDVARFRLLANAIAKPGNEKLSLGAHDINILYTAYIKGMDLGEKELWFLARLGFQNLANENSPLWCWYSPLADAPPDPAVVSSFVGANDNETVGAITVLTALARDRRSVDRLIEGEKSPDWIKFAWFSDRSSTKVRTAALGYLAKCGVAADFEIAKLEYDRNDYGTSRSALECMVAILLRTGQIKKAQELVLQSQFEALNEDLLRSVLQEFEDLDLASLLLGLEHRNSRIRLRAMNVLRDRGELDITLAERLLEDSDASLRFEAIQALFKLGKPLTEEKVKAILFQPLKQMGYSIVLGLSGVPYSNSIGTKLFEQYRLDVLKRSSEVELEKEVKASLLFDDNAYFALVEKYFRNHADKLRRDVDNRFDTYFEERIRRLKTAYGDGIAGQNDVAKMRDVEEFVRKKLTRRGLDVLCVAQEVQDLQRIRFNLLEGFAGTSINDATYLRKCGEWDDILTLANAEKPTFGASLLTMLPDEEFQLEVAKAIISIGKKYPISDVLSLDMPAAILKKTIQLCAESRFAKISQETLLKLFTHESDKVRKAAAIMAVRSFSVKRIDSTLREYVNGDQYRYYNVIHWLDLGASMHREDAKKVAQAASG